MGYDFKYLPMLLPGWGMGMGQPKSNEEFMHSQATRPSVGSATLDSPTIGPFVAPMEAIRETAAVPARWPSVLDRRVESLDTVRTAPMRKRDNDHAAGHAADH
jgi:hypothetical protein